MNELSKELNNLLANLCVFYRKLQNYHWNIIGKDFFVLHAKLEEYYDDINSQIDEVAEHILTLGKQPLGTMKDYLEIATMQEAKNEKIEDKEVFTKVIADYELLLQTVTSIKALAEEEKCAATSSLMDDYILDYTKKLWMLKQSME